MIARHEGSAVAARVPRARNYDAVAELVAARVKASSGRISAKRLLPAAQAAGYAGRRGTSGGWSRSASRRGGPGITVAAAGSLVAG